jgi:hypothetical protein
MVKANLKNIVKECEKFSISVTGFLERQDQVLTKGQRVYAEKKLDRALGDLESAIHNYRQAVNWVAWGKKYK